MSRVRSIIEDSISVKNELLQREDILTTVQDIADLLCKTFRTDHKVLLCGNGGSAADAQHIAAELSGRYYLERDPLFAEALHLNTSYLTAVSNDYDFDQIFSRILKAKGRPADVLIAISTSGNSPNILNAVVVAKKIGMTVVGLCGENHGAIQDHCDHCINVPVERHAADSGSTYHDRSCHLRVGGGRAFWPR